MRFTKETRRRKKGDFDIIVVGAGVAGAALAHTLGQDGKRVWVIERDLSEQDRIVGELLQPGGYLKLIEDCGEKIDSQQVFGYALFKDGKTTTLSYPLKDFSSDVSGRGSHNGRFVQRLRVKAGSLPNVRLEQGTVTSLIKERGTIKGVQSKTKTGLELRAYAPLTIVCDGCFSNLRRSLTKPSVDVPSCFVGLVAHYLKTSVAPQIPSEVYGAFIAAIDAGNIKTMPNRSMPAAPKPTPGTLLLGDSFNMRHPLTGGGMTVTLSDIEVLKNLLEPLHNMNDARALCKYLESFLHPP